MPNFLESSLMRSLCSIRLLFSLYQYLHTQFFFENRLDLINVSSQKCKLIFAVGKTLEEIIKSCCKTIKFLIEYIHPRLKITNAAIHNLQLSLYSSRSLVDFLKLLVNFLKSFIHCTQNNLRLFRQKISYFLFCYIFSHALMIKKKISEINGCN